MPRRGPRAARTGEIRAAVLETIRSIAPEIDPQRLAGHLPLREVVDLDSLDWMNLVAAVQARFGIELTLADPAHLATLDALVDHLAGQLNPRRHPTATTTARPDPAALPHAHWAIDGRGVTLRPICRDDVELEAAFVRGLSAESRYKRFMSTIGELSPRKLAELTDVDQQRHVALAAVVDDGIRVAFVGVARYIVDGTGRSCEFAIAVADAWQGSGLAGRLMQALIDLARSRGLSAMEGDVLRSNQRMRRFARQLGFVTQRGAGDRDSVRVALRL